MWLHARVLRGASQTHVLTHLLPKARQKARERQRLAKG